MAFFDLEFDGRQRGARQGRQDTDAAADEPDRPTDPRHEARPRAMGGGEALEVSGVGAQGPAALASGPSNGAPRIGFKRPLGCRRRAKPLESVYVLVRVKPTFENKVHEHLRKLKEAKEVHPLFGEYDFIIKIEGKTHEEITSTILDKIRSQEGVASTKTMVKTSF